MGPSARAISAGHGGDVPNPLATTPPAPGMGAYSGYNGATPSTPATPGMGAYSGYNGAAPSTPAAPGMGANNGYSSYGTNGVPGQTPAPGGPAAGTPAGSPAATPPLAVSQQLQPRRGIPTGDGRNYCWWREGDINMYAEPGACRDDAAGTDFSFTTLTGMITITVPEVADECNPGDDREFPAGYEAACRLGVVTVADGRGTPLAGRWTAYAGTSGFDWQGPYNPGPSGPRADHIPAGDVSYTVEDTRLPEGGNIYGGDTGNYGQADGHRVDFGIDCPYYYPGAGNYRPAAEGGCMEPVVHAVGAATATWDPIVFIRIPYNAHVTTPGFEGTERYVGTIYHSIEG